MIRNSGSGRPGRPRGSALLAVLWLSAALAAIAFSVATTVRGETERASTLADGTRAYYLATGAIDRALLRALVDDRDIPRMRFEFPTGVAVVELMPETSRLNLNDAVPEEFFRLLVALGVEPAQAQEIAAGLSKGRPMGPAGPFESLGQPGPSSFRGPDASFEEVEEALLVKGMTPDIYYGRWVRDNSGRLVRLGALRDCVSVYGTRDKFDVNSVEPALLVALGASREAANRLVQLRRTTPLNDIRQLGPMTAELGPAAARLGVGGNTIYTFQATARLKLADGKLSDLSRTVAAQIKFRKTDQNPLYHVLRWYDNVTSEVSQWP